MNAAKLEKLLLLESLDAREEKKRADAARLDLYAFRRHVSPKLIDGWWQEHIAQQLMQFFSDFNAGKAPRLVISAPPQHGKSIQIIDFIAWFLGNLPDTRIIYTSVSDRLGIRANLRLQRIFDSAKFKACFPKTQINSSNTVTISSQTLRNRDILEIIGYDGYFRNTTVCGSIVGESLDLGIIDDPIKGREQANSATIRDKTWDWFTDDFFTRFSEHAGMLAILTRWHVDDPIGRLIKKDPTIKVLKFPALATASDAFRKIGDPLFPELKSREFLLERKGLMPTGSWESLYQCNPIIAEGNFFHPDKINVIDALPADAKIKWVRAWDLGGSIDGDYTIGCKLGIHAGRVIISDISRCQDEPHGVRTSIKATASRDGYACKIRIPQDPGQAGKDQVLSYSQMLAGFTVVFVRPTGDKATRAEPFASQVNAGNVDMLRGSWNDNFVDELRSFPNGVNDDQVDAAADAYNQLAGKNINVWARVT